MMMVVPVRSDHTFKNLCETSLAILSVARDGVDRLGVAGSLAKEGSAP